MGASLPSAAQRYLSVGEDPPLDSISIQNIFKMQDKIIEKSFLGTGWSFPPSFHQGAAGLEMASEEEDIRQSLFLLISTLPGERLMRPEYGCDLHSLTFDQVNYTLRTEIIHVVEMAILRHEPRIRVEQILVTVSPETDGLVYIAVDYLVKKTNSRSNIVYPFYLQEGTNVTEI